MSCVAVVWKCVAATVVAVSLVSRAEAEDAAPKSAAEVHAAYERLDANFRRELEHLSHVAFARDWPGLGEAAQGWRPARPESGSLVFLAPDQYAGDSAAASVAPNESPGDAQPWLDQFDQLRRKQADALFQLANEAARLGQLSLAYQWASEAVRENPDHADARRVLGYEHRDGVWLASYGIRMAEAGRTWHPKFGWIAEADIPRYESGQRLVGSRWLSAEGDAARRKDIKNGWQVRTDHFLVTTNHSLEAAAELAARLERLQQVWRQLFAGFYLTENEVRRLFAGDRPPRKQVRPFRVYYHKDRAQYAAALRRRQPRIADTLGIYFDAHREAHFFAGDAAAGGSPAIPPTGEPPVATLYHEAVHQLFQETKPAAREIAGAANFWIVEGVATYFETLTEHAAGAAGPYYTVGEASAGRMPAARERLSDGFYVPLAELTRLGKDELQRHPEITKLYSQSAGLAAFLMDGEQGRYRESLVRYLAAVYAGRDTAGSLADATGSSYPELDDEYRRYLQSW